MEAENFALGRGRVLKNIRDKDAEGPRRFSHIATVISMTQDTSYRCRNLSDNRVLKPVTMDLCDKEEQFEDALDTRTVGEICREAYIKSQEEQRLKTLERRRKADEEVEAMRSKHERRGFKASLPDVEKMISPQASESDESEYFTAQSWSEETF